MSAGLMLLLSLLVVFGRCLVSGHGLSWAGSYEAFAHIWCGALLVLCFKCETKLRRQFAIYSLVAITLFEVVMFALH